MPIKESETRRFLSLEHPLNNSRLSDGEGIVILGDREVKLSPQEYRLFKQLFANPFNVSARSELAISLYGRIDDAAENGVAVTVTRIKEKFAKAKMGKLKIFSSRGGYSLVSDEEIRSLIDRGEFPESLDLLRVPVENAPGNEIVLVSERRMVRSPFKNKWVKLSDTRTNLLKELLRYKDHLVPYENLLRITGPRGFLQALKEDGLQGVLYRQGKGSLSVTITRLRSNLGAEERRIGVVDEKINERGKRTQTGGYIFHTRLPRN